MPPRKKSREAAAARLEKLGLELYFVRNALAAIKKQDATLTPEIKDILLKQLQTRSYEGQTLDIYCGSRSLPREVNPEVAKNYVPLEELLGMVSIDKTKFESYLAAHDIKLKEDEYLVSPGSCDSLSTPKLKLAHQDLQKRLEQFYKKYLQPLLDPQKKSSKKSK